MDSQRYDDADKAAAEVFAIVAQQFEEEPTPDLLLSTQAVECEEAADWDGAEAAYHEILALSSDDAAAEYKAHSDLCGLCLLLNRIADALAHARRATNAARRTELSVLFAMAARTEASLSVHFGEWTDARGIIEEALQILGDDPTCAQQRASMFVLRARCALGERDVRAAENDLAAAKGAIGPLANLECAGGIQADLARWWNTMAQLRSETGDNQGAIAARNEAVTRSRQLVSLPYTQNVHSKWFLARTLESLANALLQCDRNSEACDARAESKVILEEIGLADFQS